MQDLLSKILSFIFGLFIGYLFIVIQKSQHFLVYNLPFNHNNIIIKQDNKKYKLTLPT